MKKTLPFAVLTLLLTLVYSTSMSNEQFYKQYHTEHFGIDIVDLTKQSVKENNQYIRNSPPLYLLIHQTDTSAKLGWRSWLRVKAHLGASHDNRLLLLHPLDAKVKGTLGGFVSFEVPGRYACLIYPNFDATHKDKLTDHLKQNIRDGIDYFINYSVMRGLKVNQLYLVAHSQTYKMRVCDPGVEIYKFASEYAAMRGMIVDFDWFIDSGAPIHPLWRN